MTTRPTNPKQSKRPDDLLDNPAFLVTDVARLFRTTFDARMKRLKLGRSEWWLLSYLCYFEGSTQQELAELLDITKGGMGKLLDRLEREGLIQRAGDGDDRRAKRVYFTDSSRPVADEVDELSKQVVAQSITPFTAAEVATLTRLLGKMRLGFLAIQAAGAKSGKAGRK